MGVDRGYKEFALVNNKLALEFVRHVLEQNPDATSFGAIYDAMSRAACMRSFHNLGYQELARAGISLSLLNTANLERLIAEARRSR
ncbi:MAG: hypothetical protein D6784_02370 [Chloroflexi bacterium]|nr:MAG: hypothetical protein D6784_02370 [Chloroflexota bacterium]